MDHVKAGKWDYIVGLLNIEVQDFQHDQIVRAESLKMPNLAQDIRNRLDDMREIAVLLERVTLIQGNPAPEDVR